MKTYVLCFISGRENKGRLNQSTIKFCWESYILFRPAIQNRIVPWKTFSKFTLKTALLELNILIVEFTFERDFLFNIQANMLNTSRVNSIDIPDSSCASSSHSEQYCAEFSPLSVNRDSIRNPTLGNSESIEAVSHACSHIFNSYLGPALNSKSDRLCIGCFG